VREKEKKRREEGVASAHQARIKEEGLKLRGSSGANLTLPMTEREKKKGRKKGWLREKEEKKSYVRRMTGKSSAITSIFSAIFYSIRGKEKKKKKHRIRPAGRLRGEKIGTAPSSEDSRGLLLDHAIYPPGGKKKKERSIVLRS